MMNVLLKSLGFALLAVAPFVTGYLVLARHVWRKGSRRTCDTCAHGGREGSCNVAFYNALTAQKEAHRWPYKRVQRADGWFDCRSLGTCGQEGRFWEQATPSASGARSTAPQTLIATSPTLKEI